MKRVFESIRSSLSRPGVRAAVDNLGWLVFEKIVRLFVGVFVGFLVARYLGPDRFGLLNYAIAATGILLVLVDGGLDVVVKRELLRAPHAVGGVMFAALLIRAVSAVVSYAFVIVAVQAGVADQQQAALLLVVGGLLVQPVLMLPDLWLHARLDARASVRVQLLALTAGSFARLLLVLIDGSLVLFGWVALLEGLLAGALIIWRARRAGFRMPWGGKIGQMARKLWRDAWPLMLSGLSVGIYMRVDALMLKHMAGDAAVGIYTAAAKLSELCYFLPVALASSVLPALVRARTGDERSYNRRIQQYFDLSAAVAYVLAVPASLFAAPIIALLYGPAFAEAGDILSIHIWASVFVFLGVARGQCLVNEGLTRFYAVSTVVGALINIGLNWVLIPTFQGLGAAWATLVSYGCAAWVSSYFHREVRGMARLQSKALLIPFRITSYLARL